jgi:hypothetical protein
MLEPLASFFYYFLGLLIDPLADTAKPGDPGHARRHKRRLDRQTVQRGTPDHPDETLIGLRFEDLLSQKHFHFDGANFSFLGMPP